MATPDWYNVVTYGADPTGVSDSTSAINSAITAAASGGVVYFPTGNYKVSSLSITNSNIALVGDGPKTSILKPTTTTGDFITFGNGTTALQDCAFRDLGISADLVTRTSGANLKLNYVQAFYLERVFMYKGYDGIAIDENNLLSGKFLRNFWIDHVTHDGILIGANSSTNVGDVNLTDSIITYPGSVGVSVSTASGLLASNVEVLGAGVYGWAFATPNSSRAILGVQISQCYADTSGSHGFYLTGSNSIGNIQFVDCWGSYNVGFGFSSDCSAANGVTINGGEFSCNGQSGINLFAGTNYLVDGVRCHNNSYSANNTYYGIQVGVSGFQILNSIFGTGGVLNSPTPANLPKYGILVGTGAWNNYIISNNRCPGNVTGGIQDGGTGTNKVVNNNLAA